jgi:hypothetical protein
VEAFGEQRDAGGCCASADDDLAVAAADREHDVSGSAADKSCNGKPGHVVTVSHHIKHRCRFLLENGHSFGPLRKCDGVPPIVLPAKGTSRWSLHRPAVLPAGRYTIRSRAIDAAGNIEGHPPGPNANVLTLRVK